MDIPETLPMKKSETHSFALPSISKTHAKMPSYRTARANTTRHHSVFLDKIKDLTKDVKYQEMQTSKITEQQKQLKGMLRQFNHQTYNILSRYIDKPVDPELAKKPRATSTSMMEVKDKQISNSNDALQICKREMQLLQKKCENLKYVTVQDFQRKIDSIKTEIEQLKNSNKQIIKGNTLRGLAIKRGDTKVSHEVSQFEQQKLILQKKKQRLQEDMKFVNQEQEKLTQNHNKADEEIKKMSEDFNKYDKENKELRDQKQLVRVYNQKKKEFEQKRQKLDKKGQNTANSEQKSNNIVARLIDNFQTQPKQQSQSITTQPQPPSLSPQNTQPSQKQKQSSTKPNPNKYQYQYLKLLKQLDQITKRSKGCSQNMKQYIQKIENSKKEIVQLEGKLVVAKKAGEGKGNVGSSQVNDKNEEKPEEEKKEEKKWLFF